MDQTVSSGACRAVSVPPAARTGLRDKAIGRRSWLCCPGLPRYGARKSAAACPQALRAAPSWARCPRPAGPSTAQRRPCRALHSGSMSCGRSSPSPRTPAPPPSILGRASEIAGRTPNEAAHERGPDRLGARLADVEADYPAASGLVHGERDRKVLGTNPHAVADVLDVRVESQIGVAVPERFSRSERLDLCDRAAGMPRARCLCETVGG
jgi:hypothetical protein